MRKKFIVPVLVAACGLALAGCNGQQSDWQKARAANTTDSYEQFLKKYPSGEFSGQAQARLKELNEERDWQKARDLDTTEAYQAFLKQYPDGKWSEEARIRVENFTLAQAPSGPGAPPAGAAAGVAAGAAGAAGAAAGYPGGAQYRAPAAPAAAAPTAAPKAPAPKVTAPKATSKAAAPKAAAPAAGGGYAIQLGAFKTGAPAARHHWAMLQRRFPKELSGLESKVSPLKTPTATLYRLQATGLTEARARQVCKALKARSQPCVVMAPGHH